MRIVKLKHEGQEWLAIEKGFIFKKYLDLELSDEYGLIMWRNKDCLFFGDCISRNCDFIGRVLMSIEDE